MKEENRTNRGNGVHSYDVQKIEVLDEESPSTSNGVGTLNSELEGYPSAKLLNDVVKTMDNGQKNLAESEKMDGMRSSEVKRLVSAIKGAAGKEDTSAQVQKVMDLMVEK